MLYALKAFLNKIFTYQKKKKKNAHSVSYFNNCALDVRLTTFVVCLPFLNSSFPVKIVMAWVFISIYYYF
jgi:hypothetical protein